jgi:diaminohydroxyphosphoribosylaminopyrimidine deaminase/5-amino-6-(5-phosphoribosylamino)uracil reductase
MPSAHPLEDVGYMRRALALAARGLGRTRPNPAVGAVVVRGGRVVGEGWHRRAGLQHAEVEAIEAAGPRARGGTLYVTLEPCAHLGRTPPCVDLIVKSGIRRCVAAIRDPHPVVNGRGFRKLRARGIRVEVGLLEPEVRDLIGGYLMAQNRGRPRVTWKVASSLDGRITDGAGRSRWITGAEARRHGHLLRSRADAIVVGAGTVNADDPELTVRAVRTDRQPLRVVCDTALRLGTGRRLFGPRLARGTVVACGRRASAVKERRLRSRGVEVWRLPESEGGVSPVALARRLAAEGCHEVLIEGGATLGSSWLDAGLVDRFALFLAPKVLGSSGLAWCGPIRRGTLQRAPHGRVSREKRLGDDLFVLVELDD